MKSNCHQAPMLVQGSDEGTNHYVCTACGFACDAMNTPETEKDWLDSDVFEKLIDALKMRIREHFIPKPKKVHEGWQGYFRHSHLSGEYELMGLDQFPIAQVTPDSKYKSVPVLIIELEEENDNTK